MLTAPPLEARLWLDALPQLVWLASPDGLIHWGNRAWRSFTAQRDTDPPIDVRTRLSPDDAARFERLMSSGSTFALDLPLRDVGGELQWFHLNATREADQWLMTGSNISGLKDEQFRRQTLQGVIDASPNCIKVVDLEGRLLDMNAGGRVTMEIDDFELCRNLAWPSFWTGEARTLVEAALERACAGEASTFEAPTTTYKGSPREWEVSVAPIYDAHGHVHQVSAVSRDITARREAQDAVVALDAFVAFSEAVGTETDLRALVR
ncbi:PAS domain-containing protein (plasmid) [Deinococcus taeanensis]|uniref:PAS domain-containing protein n=1 Tax=Deinococcus taeanensis TaxID=2737050 RepID=UPI001CDBCE76|nr:PAS domain-containing protein [Deinococcus taeanensis]UBV44531.1 PAS domain-containing protein [Deinococcus taeanensis]